LAEYAQKSGVTTLADLRRWLEASTSGISPDLCKRILGKLAPADLPAFGEFLPLAHLADGGMGRVWLAAKESGPLVVVKTLKKTSISAEGTRRFEREVDITRQLDHPNIVRSLGCGESQDGSDYIVLEYVESGDLRELVDARYMLPEPLALAIMVQVADALQAAHLLSVVHRDIKPSNIFVGHDGLAKLADFGIARLVESGTMLTMQGAVLGSPQFMSPEQARGDKVDILSDIYAMGTVLFFCLAGRPPFGGGMQDVLYQHCNVEAPDIRTACMTISERTAKLIARCLAKKPSDRPADPLALRIALEEAICEQGRNVGDVLKDETHKSGGGERTIGFSQAQANYEFPTMIADLSGATAETSRDTRNFTPIAIQHLTANLLAGDVEKKKTDEQPESHVSPGSTSVSKNAIGAKIFAGDAAAAITSNWISLQPKEANDPTSVHLFARPNLVMGKLRTVDICLRNYPVEEHKEVLQRISRQHLTLRYDPLGQECVLEDMGGVNGTLIDGVALANGENKALGVKSAHMVVLAEAVSLWMRCHRSPHAGEPQVLQGLPPAHEQTCGLDSDLSIDSVIITRAENRPEMAYAMVLRSITIGGPGAELALAGARSLATVHLAYYAGRWIWRPAASAASDAPWKPLMNGQPLDCGGHILVAQVGNHEQF
jgi:serine/threonine protein kinase